MRFYEVFIANNTYHSNTPLTYSSDDPLEPMSIVTVSLRQRIVTGFVLQEVNKPNFETKNIKASLSKKAMPPHCLELAQWLERYYVCSLGEALRQFAPSRPSIRQTKDRPNAYAQPVEKQLELEKPLIKSQLDAISSIKNHPSTTVLLHGETGSGKTRVYLELAKETLGAGKSVLLLTPEISLTSQLASSVAKQLDNPVFVLHSRLTVAERKKIWLAVLETTRPIVVIGPRSALFSPIHNLGLIVLDEAHEPAYKQEQGPRYHAVRVASQLGLLTGAKVILGTATPTVGDYYLALQHKAVVRMKQSALGKKHTDVECEIVDIKDRRNFSINPYLSNQLIDAIKSTLLAKKQVMIYLNRRGSARIILCENCGWQMLCPNCDIPLVYHADHHVVRCHTCGYNSVPPHNCPKCNNPDIIYKSIGTKALTESVAKLFPDQKVQRFDSDNLEGEQLNEIYHQLHRGDVDILVGTQLLAKGLDLPKLGLVGIIAAETSLYLPDYTAEERTFQLLYQVMGRVGRGHSRGHVVLQSYNPSSIVVKTAIKRDYKKFYDYVLSERQQFRFPPFSHLLQLTCKRATLGGAERAATHLKDKLASQGLRVEIIGPTPSFYARRGKHYYWQLVIKSKRHEYLVQLAKTVPSDWTVNLDPTNLL